MDECCSSSAGLTYFCWIKWIYLNIFSGYIFLFYYYLVDRHQGVYFSFMQDLLLYINARLLLLLLLNSVKMILYNNNIIILGTICNIRLLQILLSQIRIQQTSTGFSYFI